MVCRLASPCGRGLKPLRPRPNIPGKPRPWGRVFYSLICNIWDSAVFYYTLDVSSIRPTTAFQYAYSLKILHIVQLSSYCLVLFDFSLEARLWTGCTTFISRWERSSRVHVQNDLQMELSRPTVKCSSKHRRFFRLGWRIRNSFEENIVNRTRIYRCTECDRTWY